MQIDHSLLNKYDAKELFFSKGEIILEEGARATNYFQIIEGEVIMQYMNEDGKEINIGIFKEGQSFGEPPLFIDELYPASAIAYKDCTLFKLPKDSLFRLLEENPYVKMTFIKTFASRIYSKINFSKNLINQKSEYRILTFLKKYKEENDLKKERVLIPFTRKEIADFTGLRIETVIRTLSLMRKKKKIDIINHKIYY